LPYSLQPYQPLHPIGATSVTVQYRDGREVIDSGPGQKPQPMTEGLTTVGVFGPILAVVLLDAAQSKLTWSRWEQSANSLEAVFSYSVPKKKSHYEVNYCCIAVQAATQAANVEPFLQLVGYHGQMAVDPATGTILRLELEAELKATDPVVKAAMVVEYAPVEIGRLMYICPVRNISSSLAQTVQFDPNFKFALPTSYSR